MNPPPTVFITGSSSGIGLATSREMKSRGWKVFASARKAEDLERLQKDGFEPVKLDMADPVSVDAAADAVLKACGGELDALVNNAGYGQPGALEDLKVEAMRHQLAVNVIGLQQLTNRVLPGMIRRGSGRIVHVSSVVGRVALPFLGIYSASKFAVEALADAQRVELSETGVHLSVVEPGPVRTKFGENAVQSTVDSLDRERSRFSGLYRKEMEHRREDKTAKAFALPPEAVAAKIAHALTSRRPRRRYKVTFPAYLGALISRIAPDAWIDAILIHELNKRSPAPAASGK